MGDTNPLLACVQFVVCGISIATLVLTILVFANSFGDPLDKQLDEGEKWDDFFTSTQVSFLQKQCKCGEEIVNDFCTEEQKLSGCVDISLNPQDKKYFLRTLDMEPSKCQDLIDKVKKLDPTEKLSKIFDLKMSKIHNMILGILIIICVSFGLMLVITFGVFLTFCCQKAAACIVSCVMCFMIIGIATGITNLVIFIISAVGYFGGDIPTYVDFINCNGVDKQKFESKFGTDILKVKKYYVPFFALNIIYLVLNCCFNIFSGAANKNEQ